MVCPNYYGPDRFTFKVNDGTLESAEAEVSITIRSVDVTGSAIGWPDHR